jgi:hypothetical protein
MTVSQISCSQPQISKQTNITKTQYNSISKSIKTFKYNPTYALKIDWVWCTYEVYINNMLVNFSFETGRSAGEQNIDFPQYILKSGRQKIKVVVYPRAIKEGQFEAMLSPETELSVRIVHQEYGKGKLNKEKEVYNHKLTKPIVKAKSFEWSGDFDAEVPYSLKGWSDGTDLSKEDPKALEKEALAAITKFGKAFEHKDVQTLVNMIYNREKEVAQAFFFTSGENVNYDHGWEELEQEAKAVTAVQPLQGYTMRLFGDGKVVSLLRDSPKEKDYPALLMETKDKMYYYNLYFYRPQAGAPLEVIR